ncbi:hypothetical protein J6590_031487, partial [Homalodisca vitripennis]
NYRKFHHCDNVPLQQFRYCQLFCHVFIISHQLFQLSVITTIPSHDQPIETIVSSITVTMCRYNSSGIVNCSVTCLLSLTNCFNSALSPQYRALIGL